jgi:hypothetical protein
MKKLFLLLIIFSFNQVCFSQRTEEWKQYLKDSVYNSDNEEYIYLYFTKGGKLLKHLYYCTKKGQNVLSINYGDSIIVDRVIYNPNLFEIVKNNLKKLKKVENFFNYNREAFKFRYNFNDTGIVCFQVGVKYKNLHFNHFPKFSIEQIGNQKNEKRREGMKIINQLYEFLEMAEINK